MSSKLQQMRSFFIAFIAAVLASIANVLAGTRNPAIFLVSVLAVTVVTWVLSEWLLHTLGPRLRGLRWRSPLVWKTAAEDLGSQVEALMGMPLHQWPLIRARTAVMFAEFQLRAAERWVLVIWASLALEGGADLDYHVDTIPGLSPRWLLYCSNRNEHPSQRLNGTITCFDPEIPHLISAVHRSMVTQLRTDRRQPGW